MSVVGQAHLGHAFLATGAALVAWYAVADGGTANAVAYSLVGVLATAAVVVGMARHRPGRPATWLCVAAGQAAWAVGNVVHLGLAPLGGADPHLVANALYLLGYALLTAGMWQMMFHRCAGARLASSLDGTMLAVGMGLTVWVLLAQPVLAGPAPVSGEAASGLTFLFFDITVAASAWAVLTTPGARTPAFGLLIGAVAGQLAGNTSYVSTALGDTFGDDAARLSWLVSSLLWGAAALHPSMRTLTTPGSTDETGLTSSRLVVLLLAVLVGPVAAYTRSGIGDDRDPVVLVASVLLVVLTMSRMVLALRTTEHLRDGMAHQAAHDPLTGLVNRTHMRTRLEALLHDARTPAGEGEGVGVLLIDLDGFKHINDTLGHAAGDAALCEVARRLRAGSRAQDCAARLGGDEFVVLLRATAGTEEVLAAARRLLAGIAAPASWQGQQLRLGASIGAAFTADGATTAEALLAEADAAAYRAKANGRGQVELFDDDARAAAAARAEVEWALHRALRTPARPDADPLRTGQDGALELHYQPVVDLHTGEQHGAEALIRWRRRDGSLTPPDDFIPLAESSDLICDVGRWVLAAAGHQLAAWSTDPEREGWRVAVNISARHLKHPGVVADVTAALSATGARAERLVLEVTETVLVDSSVVTEHLRQLRALGVEIAIDDFGTGYTSISQLQQLPADYLKIDRSLVASELPSTAELVQLVIRAASAFGLAVVAEGIEHPAQHDALRAAGAQLGQGWLFGRPAPVPAVPVPPTRTPTRPAQRRLTGPASTGVRNST